MVERVGSYQQQCDAICVVLVRLKSGCSFSGASDIGTGYEARADLCNAILGLFLSLLLHLPSPSATACATRSPLLSLLLTSLQRAQDLHSSTLRLVLALVTHLWPFAAQSLSVPLPAHVASTILRLAAR